jgi:polyphosphate glucokinase
MYVRSNVGERSMSEAHGKILAIDVGGSHVKMMCSPQSEKRQFISGPKLTAEMMVEKVRKLTGDWQYRAISIGYPAPVVHGRPFAEPPNLGKGWVGFNFAKAFERPVKIINDAAMQAMGSYEGGRMLFLGLGTGLGSAMIVEGVVEPMELAHLEYKHRKTFEDYLGLRGLRRLGLKHWREAVADVVERMSTALEPDYVVIGGGNARRLKKLPPKARLGNNENAFKGGFRLWDETRAHA